MHRLVRRCLVSGCAADRRTIIGRLIRTRASLRVDRGARILSSAARAQIVRKAVGPCWKINQNDRKPARPHRRRGEAPVARACCGNALSCRNTVTDEKTAFPSWTPSHGAFNAHKSLFSHSSVSSSKRGARPARHRARAPVPTTKPRNKAQMSMFAGTIEETRNGRC